MWKPVLFVTLPDVVPWPKRRGADDRAWCSKFAELSQVEGERSKYGAGQAKCARQQCVNHNSAYNEVKIALCT